MEWSCASAGTAFHVVDSQPSDKLTSYHAATRKTFCRLKSLAALLVFRLPGKWAVLPEENLAAGQKAQTRTIIIQFRATSATSIKRTRLEMGSDAKINPRERARGHHFDPDCNQSMRIIVQPTFPYGCIFIVKYTLVGDIIFANRSRVLGTSKAFRWP